VISLKQKPYFPTTVIAGAGSGGEFVTVQVDKVLYAWGTVYMTSYSRLEENRPWEKEWPKENGCIKLQWIIKASNGASDFGNKFGQPLITGSVLTFEHEEACSKWVSTKLCKQLVE
jgi:phosphoribosylformylglycinamidine synthase